ncbi:MAG: hypothetical protein AB9869_28470 [Verrucomicrobiia bacterium]
MKTQQPKPRAGKLTKRFEQLLRLQAEIDELTERILDLSAKRSRRATQLANLEGE